MNKSIALGAVFAVAISMGVTPAFAQYMGSGGAGNQDGGHPSMSLENTLALAKAKVTYAADNPGSGSGTPYLAADGVIGTIFSILSSLTGQLGPNYDPLFFDVMVYIFGTIMFTVFLLALIAYWVRVHGWGYKDNRERWVDELDRHFENEGIGLIPDNGKYW
jgi:hypothetical protein